MLQGEEVDGVVLRVFRGAEPSGVTVPYLVAFETGVHFEVVSTCAHSLGCGVKLSLHPVESSTTSE